MLILDLYAGLPLWSPGQSLQAYMDFLLAHLEGLHLEEYPVCSVPIPQL